jgi:predicted negative regulator of RcsB-dependent stress response
LEDYLSEKEQWDAIKGGIREYGPWIVAGVAIGAAGLGGWWWYQQHRDDVALQASAKYEQAMESFDRGNRTAAFVSLGELERDYPGSPYVDQAKLFAARTYVEAGELDKAANELQAVAADSKDPELVLLARMRLARVQIAQQKPGLALATLSGVQAGAFAPQFHEIQGDAYYAKGDKASALKEYISAKTGSFGSSPGEGELDLKIADLSPSSPPAIAAASK